MNDNERNWTSVATDPGIRYPHISVKLSGEDGNGFAIVGRVIQALKTADVSDVERAAFFNDATSGDYDHLLQTVMRWVAVLSLLLLLCNAAPAAVLVAPNAGSEEHRFFHVILSGDRVFASKVQAQYVASIENGEVESLQFASGLPSWIGAEVLPDGTVVTLSDLDGNGFTVLGGPSVAFPEVWSEPIAVTAMEHVGPSTYKLDVDGPWMDTHLPIAPGIDLVRFGFFADSVTVGTPEPSSLVLLAVVVLFGWSCRRAAK